jgi:hypothetical protein
MIASTQFADDPNSIMGSVIDLLDRTIEQVEGAARKNETRDRIASLPPNTNDPIDDPRITSPKSLGNDKTLGISSPYEGNGLHRCHRQNCRAESP